MGFAVGAETGRSCGYQVGLACAGASDPACEWERAGRVVNAGGVEGLGAREDLGARGEGSPGEVSEMPAAGRAPGAGEADQQVRGWEHRRKGGFICWALEETEGIAGNVEKGLGVVVKTLEACGD